MTNKFFISCLIASALSASGVSAACEPAKLDATRKLLVDSNATAETVALFYNLKESSKRHILVGQQDPDVTYSNAKGETDIRKMTGRDPAIWGYNFGHITNEKNDGKGWFHAEEHRIIGLASAAYDNGMINTFLWCLKDPYTEKTFMSKEMKAEDLKRSFRSILPGGEKHEWYKGKLRKVAEAVGSIKGHNGTLSPVIFRPFHELDGNWFWWGRNYCTAKEFQECWKFTVTYLRDDLKVHNILYAFSPDCSFKSEKDYLERYPGDAYVDVVGFDDYVDFEKNRAHEAATKVSIISNYAKTHGKLAALTELGYREKPVPVDLYTGYYMKALADPSVELAYMMFWRQSKKEGICYVPVPGSAVAPDFTKFINHPRLRLLSTEKNLYTVHE